MFEKEAEEYAHEHCCDSCKNLQARYRKVYQDGAEFGYNKANEWHFVKDGDLPAHLNRVLVFTDEGVGFGIYGLDNGKWYTCDTDLDVIAWKEIELPKESEING